MIWSWLALFALVGVLLLLQCKLSQRTIRSARYWTAGWFVIGLSVVGLIYPMYEHAWLGAKLVEPSDRPGTDASIMFVSAYLLEYALSFDSVLAISLVCQLYRVPKQHQPRVVLFGLFGAVFIRLGIVTGAVGLARAFTWMFCVYGVLSLWTSAGVLRASNDEHVELVDSRSAIVQKKRMRLARFLWRRQWLTDRDFTGAFSVIQDGRRVLTMAAACVLSIVLVDIAFALDSAVAVASVSKTTFILVTSTLLASIALRSWVSMPGALEGLQPPRAAIAALLALVGFRLLAQSHVVVPHEILLVAIAGLVCAAVAESLLSSRHAGPGS